MFIAFRLLKKFGLGLLTRLINPGIDLSRVTVNGICKFNRRCRLGKDCHFNGVWVDGPGEVSFGNSCHFGREIIIFTQNHDYQSDEKLPYGDGFVVKSVRFGDYVWVGSRVIILPGAVIGDGAIIQAGAVVHGKLEPCGIYGGNPAVKFGSRNVEVFGRLRKHES